MGTALGQPLKQIFTQSKMFCIIKINACPSNIQLELKEKHYDKLKRKTCYWILVLALLLVGHSVAFSFLVRDAFDMIDNRCDNYSYFLITTTFFGLKKVSRFCLRSLVPLESDVTSFSNI